MIAVKEGRCVHHFLEEWKHLFGNPGSALLEVEQFLLAASTLPALHIQITLAHQLSKPLGLRYLPPPLPAQGFSCSTLLLIWQPGRYKGCDTST